MENYTNSNAILIIYLRIQTNLQQMGHRSYQMAQPNLIELLTNNYIVGTSTNIDVDFSKRKNCLSISKRGSESLL